MDAPTFQVAENELENLLSFIYKHEMILKEFGAMKIQLNTNCNLALKKRPKKLVVCSNMKHIVKIREDEPVYAVQNVDHINQCTDQGSLVADEDSFWSSLTCSSNKQRQVNISLIPNKSFFLRKTSRSYFDIHRLSYQSLLKIGGTHVARQFVPCARRAHGPGAIFPLSCTEQRLFSIDYHHEGGIHHWYIIPNRERDLLRHIVDQQSSSVCLDHGKFFIDPSVLDKNHIRYHRIIQQPNEFVVLSAGTLAQSFTEDASWSESISFALPSWIEEGHAYVSTPSCQCDIPWANLTGTVDVTLFKHDSIQRYINSHLNIIENVELMAPEGFESYL